jgi:hypothetical protein
MPQGQSRTRLAVSAFPDRRQLDDEAQRQTSCLSFVDVHGHVVCETLRLEAPVHLPCRSAMSHEYRGVPLGSAAP